MLPIILPKSISGLLIAVMIVNSVLFAAIMQPAPAQAGLPVIDVAAIAQAVAKFVWDSAKFVYEKAVDIKNAAVQYWQQFRSSDGIIAEATTQLFLITLHIALSKFTNDIVAWINGGGKGKIRVLQDPGKFLGDTLDAAGGVLAGAILNVDPTTLCNADFLKLKLKAVFAGPYSVPTFDEKVACTFSGMQEGLRKFKENFNNGGWTAFVQYTERQNNPIGQALTVAEERQRIATVKGEEARAELGISKGFSAQKKCFITRNPKNLDITPQTGGRYGYRADGTWGFIPDQPTPSVNFQGAAFDIEGKELTDDVIQLISNRHGAPTDAEGVKGWIIANGGGVECKTVTPAEQISNLASYALQAPIKKIESAIEGLFPKTGTGMGSILKPYVLAITNAGLNQLIKKEKGLIASAFTRPQKPRKNQRQVSNSLQENARVGASAGALVGSVNDFRSFLLKALLDFNIFATSASIATAQADATFGRTSIDEPNWDATSCVVPSVNAGAGMGIDPISSMLVTDPLIFRAPNSCFIDNRYVWRSDGSGAYDASWTIGGNRGWPARADNDQGIVGRGNYGAGDPTQSYAIQYDPNDRARVILTTPDVNTLNNIYTISPGKMFHEEAAWCGAYFEEIPTGSPVVEPYGHVSQIATVDPRTVCTDGSVGIWYELSGTTGNVYLAGARADGTFFWNCLENTGDNEGPRDPATGQLYSGRVLAYTIDWGSVSSDTSSFTFILSSPSHPTCNATATTTPSTGTQGFMGSDCVPGSGATTAQLGLEVWENKAGEKTTQMILERYFSPTFEGGTATLMNMKQTFTSTSGNMVVPLEVSANNATLLRGNFYPELTDKMRELMEKSYVIAGYHYPATTTKDYLSPLADQLGATPDDDPKDNHPNNPRYNDSVSTTITTKEGCGWPNAWNETPGTCLIEGYKGSVADVTTRYNDLNQIYQQLFAGLQDENSLEGVDKDLKILSPEESNIRLAMIGERCPSIPPSATSTPNLIGKCPVLTSGEYNMARKFIFERDSASGLTTGFATNPFTAEKSSSLAGFLNLEDMTSQLGSLPPDKNIVKLIRIRQLLEQLQVAPQPIAVPGKTNVFLNPQPLTGVDIVQISIPGYEKIQDWLNNTTTRNLDIQELIGAPDGYGYTTAREAYPQISRELDDIFDDITNQIIDKLKDVFLKRTELALEEARLNAQERLTRFIEYTRDLNADLKLEIENTASATAPKMRIRNSVGEATANSMLVAIESTADILKLNAKNLDLFAANWTATTTPTVINRLLGLNGGGLNDGEKRALIDSAIYKIQALARFIGVDIKGARFRALISAYNTATGQTPEALTDDFNLRVKKALRDTYLLYTGLTDLENGFVNGLPCFPATSTEQSFCQLTQLTINGAPFQIYKDARIKLDELQNNFGLMLDEISAIKQEYQDLISSIQGEQQSIDDMAEAFQNMQGAYDKANACFGFSTDPNALWMPSASVRVSYGTTGPVLYGTLVGFAAAGAGAGVAALLGVSLTATAALIAIPVIGIFAAVGFGVWMSRTKKKKAERRAKAALQRALRDCAQGIDDYNRLLGQLADNFVCGKINKKYEDR